MGCCFGTLGSTIIPQLVAGLQKCGVSPTLTPCPKQGVAQRELIVTTTLSGLTTSTFDAAAQVSFRQGMATTAGVEVTQVTITTFSAAVVRRAAGLQVNSQILLEGTEVSDANANAIQAQVQDTATLTSNINTASASNPGTPSVTVTSSSAVVNPIIAPQAPPAPPASSTSSGLSGGAIAGIIIGVLVGVAIVAAIVYFAMGRSTGKGDGGNPDNISAVKGHAQGTFAYSDASVGSVQLEESGSETSAIRGHTSGQI